MNTVLVTGAAGFIGSHLSERLLEGGSRVIGIDAFTPYYDPARKKRNIERLSTHAQFEFLEGDLQQLELARLIGACSAVYHLAGQPGVRASWGTDFDLYVAHNVLATQRLLEAAVSAKLDRFVYASSSSVYGNVRREVLREADVPEPYSPYGVTKLAGEHLVASYHANFNLPTVALRFFTVFGPRQRPDMAFQRIMEALRDQTTFTVFGDGRQVRDFTYVDDIVAGCLAAGASGRAGAVYNLGGSNTASLNEVLALAEEVSGRKLQLERKGKERGDVDRTCAGIDLAQKELAYRPTVDLREGLRRQWLFEAARG